MAKQDAFTTEEWNLLRLAPSLITGGMSAAEASKEGGFLGFGGVRVSDKEQAFITEVKKAVGIG